MEQPQLFSIYNEDHLVCRLKKSIYGFKQSPLTMVLLHQWSTFILLVHRKHYWSVYTAKGYWE